MRCSILFNPAEAASSMAICSSILILATPARSTAMEARRETTLLAFGLVFCVGLVWMEESRGEEGWL